VILCCTSSLLSISISPCAKWNETGITIAGTGVSGSDLRQLSYPQGIFIHDKTKYLYVSDSYNNRIQLFQLDQSTTIGVTLLSQLSQGYKIYLDDLDDDFPTIYIAMNGANRVEKWVKGAIHGIQVGDQCLGCTGVWLDKEKNVYMAEHDKHRILKWSPITNITTIVAGETGKKGPRADHLNEPQGIFVDKTTDALYIADLVNHRIQKWSKDAKEGVTVAGSSEGDPGSDAKSLDRPYGLRVDEETKTVYVVDLLNNRIQRWKNGANEGETIAGGNGMYIIH
jgi:DNA-binding beta-propeller fold protein YncE